MEIKPLHHELEDRFWSKVVIVPYDRGCWIWCGARTSKGYGALAISRKPVTAHRISWIIHRGAIPEGIHVLHKCDNPACVNPDHLWLGTNAENSIDASKKGRKPVKFSPDEVGQMKSLRLSLPRSEIIKRFNISEAQLSRILNGKLRVYS